MKRWRTEERQKLQGWKRGVSRERETGNGERRWVCWCSSSHHLTVPHFNHHQFSPPISSGHASTSAAASGAAGAEETTAPMMPRCKHLNGNASFISTALVFLSAGKKKKNGWGGWKRSLGIQREREREQWGVELFWWESFFFVFLHMLKFRNLSLSLSLSPLSASQILSANQKSWIGGRGGGRRSDWLRTGMTSNIHVGFSIPLFPLLISPAVYLKKFIYIFFFYKVDQEHRCDLFKFVVYTCKYLLF